MGIEYVRLIFAQMHMRTYNDHVHLIKCEITFCEIAHAQKFNSHEQKR